MPLPRLGFGRRQRCGEDAMIHGLTVKAPVTAASSEANVPLTSLMDGVVVDGVTLHTNDRVLLAAQTLPIENGIYVIGATGSVRANDLGLGASASGAYAFIDKGTINCDKSYICITNAPNAVVGTNDLGWVQFGARNTALAGKGLVTGDASTLDVNVDNTTVVITNNFVGLKHPDVKVKAERGLLRSTTDGTTATAGVRDASDATVLGLTVGLGQNVTLQPDFTVVPDKDDVNTFTKDNTFSSTTEAAWTPSGTPGGEPTKPLRSVLAARVFVNHRGLCTSQ